MPQYYFNSLLIHSDSGDCTADRSPSTASASGSMSRSGSEELSGDFINDSAYTQHDDVDGGLAMYFRLNSKIQESPGYEHIDFTVHSLVYTYIPIYLYTYISMLIHDQ